MNQVQELENKIQNIEEKVLQLAEQNQHLKQMCSELLEERRQLKLALQASQKSAPPAALEDFVQRSGLQPSLSSEQIEGFIAELTHHIAWVEQL